MFIVTEYAALMSLDVFLWCKPHYVSLISTYYKCIQFPVVHWPQQCLNHIGRKAVFEVRGEVKLILSCSATETTKNIEIKIVVYIAIRLTASEIKTCSSDCADAQANLCFCCSHTTR